MDPTEFDQADFARETGVSRETMSHLERYRALLAEWNERMNLVGPSALAAFWLRHAYDSAQLLEAATQLQSSRTGGSTSDGRDGGSSGSALQPPSPASPVLPPMGGETQSPPLVWADIGAGAGFPGLVLAILLRGRPGARVHLIESLTKRCKFLQAVIDDLDLPAEVHNARAESLRLTGIDIVTARACAPMDKLLGYAQPIMKAGARGLFLKGRDVESELSAARQKWKFEAVLIPSRSDPSGRIVSIERAVRG